MAAKAAATATAAAAKNGESEGKKQSVLATDILNSISLESIDAEMAELESQRSELQKQIDALKACRKIIDIRVNGKSGCSEEQRQRMAAARAAKKAAKLQQSSAAAMAAPTVNAGTPTSELATVEKISRYLARAESAKPYQMAQSVGISSPEILRLLKKYNDRFMLDPADDRWSLRGGH